MSTLTAPDISRVNHHIMDVRQPSAVWSEDQVNPQAVWNDQPSPPQMARRCICSSKQRVLALFLLFLMLSTLAAAQLPHGAMHDQSLRLALVFDILPSGHAMSLAADGESKSTAADPAPKCASFAASTTKSSSHELQAEWAMGRKLAARAEKTATLIEDPALTQYLNDLEQTIVRNSDLRGCFVVKLIEDVEANAYSLPGGFLYVTSGLVLMTETEAALTAALAHETGHVTARHFARIGRKRRIGGGLALAGGPAGYVVRCLVGPLLTRKLIRNSEFEADRLSVKYQIASGYDPKEFSRLLESIFEEQNTAASFVERLFDTHPWTKTRIKRLNKAMNRSSRGTIECIVDSSKFHQFKERLSTLTTLVSYDPPKGNAYHSSQQSTTNNLP